MLTRTSLKVGPAAPGDRFGAAVAHAETATGCSLLVIGAPGVDGRGAVYITTDSAEGFGKGGTLKLEGAPGDRFGSSVVLSRAASSDPNQYELWVGSPRRDVAGAVDAGAIRRYHLVTESDGRLQVENAQTFTQGGTTVPGTAAEANDRFGEVLAGAEAGVVVGVPHEDVGSAVDAGMVILIQWSRGNYRAVQHLTQSTARVPGTPESGDRFGAAVAPCAHAIGAPGEDVGSVRDAGLVQEMRGCGPSGFEFGRAITQSTKGVPGTAEAGDRFGAAVAERVTAEDGTSLYIGAPGEDLGTVANAGAVVAEHSCGLPPCGWHTLTQGDGLAGKAEAGDALGSTIAVRDLYRPVFGGDIHETSFPVVGAPGEDLGSAEDAGAALSRVPVSDGGVRATSFTFSAGPRQQLRFGSVFAADVYGHRDF